MVILLLWIKHAGATTENVKQLARLPNNKKNQSIEEVLRNALFLKLAFS